MVSPIKTTNIQKKSSSDPSPLRLLLALLLLLFIQLILCGQFSSRVVRVDLLLVAPIYLALAVPLFTAIVACFLVGFMMDVISGSFIGFHIFLYVTTAVFVALVEQKINLSGVFQQLIALMIAWTFEGLVLQFFLLFGSKSYCEHCVFTRLFVYRSLTVAAFGLIILLLIPVVSGYRIRRMAN
ncbi:MAG TPA: rod shape-determining protein MreD [Deltaproteobacteria bacterium]|nr:rod shape-determining protein MreD [Deltaproteobacteria bacterium]